MTDRCRAYEPRLRVRIAALLFSVLVPTTAFAWIEYSDIRHFFSINFPREPDIRDFEYTSEYGANLPARVYSVEENGSRYSLTVIDYNVDLARYNEIPDKTDDTNIRTMWVYDQRGAIAYEAAKIRQRGGKILYDGWHHIDRIEGLNLVIQNDDGSSTYAALYLHARRLYILEADAPPGAPPQGLFQQSLSFLDEQGNRIRYELTPEGERTRIR